MKPKDQEKQKAINQATLSLVAEKGIAGVKIAEVARKAGVSPSTVYVYYESKEDLLISLYQEVLKHNFARIMPKICLDRPYKIIFREIWESYFQFCVENYETERFLEQMRTSPYFYEEIRAISLQEIQRAYDFFDLGKKSLLLKDISTETLIKVMEGITQMLAESHYFANSPITQADLDEGFWLVWDCLKQ